MSILSQRSLAGGEIAPSLYARIDSSKYQIGLRQLRNMYIMRAGGSLNRPGTYFVSEARNVGAAIRLIPYLATSQITYLLELGNGYIKPFKNGAHILESTVTVTGFSFADPVSITAPSHGFSDGDEIQFTDSGLEYLGGAGTFFVDNSALNTFTLQYLDGSPVNGSALTVPGSPMITGVARVYSIASTYLTAELAEIQYAQNGDDLTLVHPLHKPANVRRTNDTSWSLTDIAFGAQIATPTGFSVVGGSNQWRYAVTAIDEVTAEESLALVSTGPITGALAAGNDFADVTGASEYRLYLDKGFGFGLIGISQTSDFPILVVENLVGDFSEAPYFTNFNPFPNVGEYPRAVSYSQQRLMLANADGFTQTLWTSWLGAYKNFNRKGLTKDNQSIIFTMAGKEGSEIRHILDLGKLVIMTNTGEWVAEGGDTGIITPTQINLKQHSYNGCSTLFPLIVDNTALYVQFNGSIVRDLAFQNESDGYRGNDLTVYANHLFDGYSINDWSYQKTPHSVVWAVRDDGIVLGLTYIREQQIWAWHRHDTDGLFENTAAVSEQLEDAIYFVVKRTIDGVERRYIERLEERLVGDIKDSIFMDSALSYDGRNTSATTMTLSGGTTWDYTELLTLTASASFFAATDVGNAIHITGPNGEIIRFTIAGYTSPTVVTGNAQMTVPVSMRAVAFTSWAKAVDELLGLWHLEGKDVSVFADGFVVASPNNSSYVIVTVTDGAITLDKPYSVIHVGLPYLSDIETLDIDSSQGETMANKKMAVQAVHLQLEKSRGIWAGGREPVSSALDGLSELKARDEEGYEDPIDLVSGKVEIIIDGGWNSNGRVFIRQVDPVPLSVLAISPEGLIPLRR